MTEHGQQTRDLFAVKPPHRCYVAATKDKAVQYEAIHTLGDLKDAIASDLSVVFGFTVQLAISAINRPRRS